MLTLSNPMLLMQNVLTLFVLTFENLYTQFITCCFFFTIQYFEQAIVRVMYVIIFLTIYVNRGRLCLLSRLRQIYAARKIARRNKQIIKVV